MKQTSPTRVVPVLVTWVVLAVLMLGAPSHAMAQGTDAQRRAAIASAMDQAGGSGKVLSVKPYKNKDGKPGFRIRVLTDGRVRTFDIAAESSQ